MRSAGAPAWLSDLYAAAARRRRERYARRPDLRRRLRQPVISIGNIAVGGRGKTPLVACLARLLLDAGERPAILSRGYRRTLPADGVVVVSTAAGLQADLRRAGDEPLMLARQLPGVSVLVGSDRYLSGRLAEHHLAATVHLLDDGFQHLQLERDIDLVLVSEEDLGAEARTLPSGRLRERSDALRASHAVLSPASTLHLPEEWGLRLFPITRRVGAPVFATGVPEDGAFTRDAPVLVVAGIAHPAGFVADVSGQQLTIAGSLVFPDHHPFSERDATRIWAEAARVRAQAILTTEKDLMRLLPFRPFPVPVAFLPLTMEPEPLPEFRDWLCAALRTARDIIVA